MVDGVPVRAKQLAYFATRSFNSCGEQNHVKKQTVSTETGVETGSELTTTQHLNFSKSLRVELRFLRQPSPPSNSIQTQGVVLWVF